MQTREELLQSIIDNLQDFNLEALKVFDSLFIQKTLGCEIYNVNTSEARIQEIKQRQELEKIQADKDRKAEKERQEAEYNTFRETNPTMQILRNSTSWIKLAKDGDYYNQACDILTAYKHHHDISQLMIDSFSLGVIAGKQSR